MTQPPLRGFSSFASAVAVSCIGLGGLWPSPAHAEDAVKSALQKRDEAYVSFFQEVMKNPKQSPAQLESLRQKAIEPAQQEVDAAAHGATQALIGNGKTTAATREELDKRQATLDPKNAGEKASPKKTASAEDAALLQAVMSGKTDEPTAGKKSSSAKVGENARSRGSEKSNKVENAAHAAGSEDDSAPRGATKAKAGKTDSTTSVGTPSGKGASKGEALDGSGIPKEISF